MPYTSYEPEKLNFLITKDQAEAQDAESVFVSLKGDTVSWVCGNGDGESFCGSTGASTEVYFTDEQGAAITMPHHMFDWDGTNLVVEHDQVAAQNWISGHY